MSRYSINYRNQIRSRYDELDGRQIIQGNFHQITCDTLIFETMTGSAGYFNQINSTNTTIDSINPTVNVDITGDINLNGNINMTGGYYNYNSVPIDNSFYPALSNISTIKAVSSWTNRTITLNQPSQNGIAWSPELGLFASIGQQGLEGRIVTSPDAINWTVRNNYVPFINNVNAVKLLNCNNGSGNTITCTSTSGLATGTNLRISGTVTTSDPFVTQVVNGTTFITSSLISGLSNTTLITNGFTCTNNTGLIIDMQVSGYTGGPGALSSRGCIAIPSSTQFILSSNRDWTNVSCIGDKSYQGIVWCKDLNGVGYFISTATNAPSDGKQILTSSDGITWTRRDTPVGYNVLVGIAYSPSLKRVVANAATSGFVWSDDGINWNGVLNPVPTNSWGGSIAWSPQLNLFVSLAGSGVANKSVAISPDGINWTSVTAPYIGGNNFLVWSPELGLFCAIGGSTNPNNVMISKDGINWDNSYSTPVLLNYRACAWSSQFRCFVAVSGNRFTYSFNGKTWVMGTTPTASGFKALTWSPELGIFVAAGNGSTLGSVTDATMTSSFKGRYPTSYNVFDYPFNNISELGLWNFQSFGRGTTVTKTTDFTVQPGESNIIVNRAATTTVTLPAASSWTGREIMIKTIQNRLVNSASSDVIPISGGVAGTAILTNVAGRYATLVSDGTNWVIMEAN